MKSLLICLLLVQGLGAAELDKYSGERLEYDLEWNPFWGIITPKAGEAGFSCDQIAGNWLVHFKVGTMDWARQLYRYDNRAISAFDSAGNLLWSRSRLTDSTSIEWRVDQEQHRVSFLKNNALIDTMALTGKMPLEALSAFYLFRNMDLTLGQLSELEVFGTDSLNRIRWSKVTIEVKGRVLLKWNGYKYLCWMVEIMIKAQDNFIPSGRVTVWVTCNSNRLPLKVATDFRYKGITLPVIGILKPLEDFQKDEP